MLAKKIAFSVIGIIILVVAYPFIMNLFFGDIAPVDDKDLMTNDAVVAASDNAFYDLEQAVKTEISGEDQSIADEFINGQANQEKIEALKTKYSEQLALFARAAKKKRFVLPGADSAQNDVNAEQKSGRPLRDADIGPHSELAKFMKGIGALITLNSAFSELSLAQGQIKEALDRAFDGLAISTMMWHDQSGLLVAMIGQAIAEGHLSSIQKILESSQVGSVLGAKYVTKLDALALPKPNWLSTKAKYEYQLFANWGMKFIFDEAPKYSSAFHKQPNKTKALIAQLVRDELKRADIACPAQLEASHSDYKEPNWFVSYFTPNSLGNRAFEGFAAFVRHRLPMLKREECKLDLEFAKTKALLQKANP